MGLNNMVTLMIIIEAILVNSVQTLCRKLVEHARCKATLFLRFLPRSNLFATKRGYLLQMLALFGRKLIYLSRFAEFLRRNSMLLRFAPTVRSRLNLGLAQILLILLFELIESEVFQISIVGFLRLCVRLVIQFDVDAGHLVGYL